MNLCGLTNLGNTCFINACIQILNNTPEWNKIIKNIKYINNNNSNNKIIIKEWIELSDLMLLNKCEISPKRFIYYIFEVAKINNKSLFTNGSQNDITEFLIFMVETIHKLISRKAVVSIKGKVVNPVDKIAVKCYKVMKEIYNKEYSEILMTFYGVNYSTITSRRTNVIHSIKPEPFFILDLPIPNEKTSLENCIRKYIEPELLVGDNAWFNEKTGLKEDVIKQICFWSFPTILIISLKRYTDENKTLIEFPLKGLNLYEFINGYKQAMDGQYDLYAVSNHYGNVMFGGHYTAIVNINNQWVHFDDNNISLISSETDIITPNAYCLFYRKK